MELLRREYATLWYSLKQNRLEQRCKSIVADLVEMTEYTNTHNGIAEQKQNLENTKYSKHAGNATYLYLPSDNCLLSANWANIPPDSPIKTVENRLN